MNKEKNIVFDPIGHSAHPLLERVEATYLYSFPEDERRDFSLFCKLLDKEGTLADGNGTFQVYSLSHAGEYIGFISFWNLGAFVYVEHFAIDASARNGGFGSTVMHRFLERVPKPVILEVEAPVDEMSRRRIGFYERLGFTLDHHPYVQPPYRAGGQWVPMLLMSYGSINLDNQFEEIKTTLYRYVYNTESIPGRE